MNQLKTFFSNKMVIFGILFVLVITVAVSLGYNTSKAPALAPVVTEITARTGPVKKALAATEAVSGSRELALRMPWLVAAAGLLILFIYAGPKLTTEAIETTRAEGIAAKESSSE